MAYILGVACSARDQIYEVVAFATDVMFAVVCGTCCGADEVVDLVDQRAINALFIGAFGGSFGGVQSCLGVRFEWNDLVTRLIN